MSGTSGVTMGNFMEHRYTYETGQAAVGDIYNWFIYSGVMYYYANEMHDRNVNVFRVLDEKMAKIRQEVRAFWRWTGGTGSGRNF